MSDWKNRKRQEGFRDLLIWASPEAVAALGLLSAAWPGASVSDVVSQALVTAAAGATAGVGNADLAGQVAALAVRVAALESLAPVGVPAEARVENLVQDPVQDPGVQPVLPAKADRPRRFDHDLIVARVIDARVRAGENFKMSVLHKELLAEGMDVPSSPSNFWKIPDKYKAQIDAAVAERLGAGGAS